MWNAVFNRWDRMPRWVHILTIVGGFGVLIASFGSLLALLALSISVAPPFSILVLALALTLAASGVIFIITGPAIIACGMHGELARHSMNNRVEEMERLIPRRPEPTEAELERRTVELEQSLKPTEQIRKNLETIQCSDSLNDIMLDVPLRPQINMKSGQTYDLSTVEELILTKQKDPVTRLPFKLTQCYPNFPMQKLNAVLNKKYSSTTELMKKIEGVLKDDVTNSALNLEKDIYIKFNEDGSSVTTNKNITNGGGVRNYMLEKFVKDYNKYTQSLKKEPDDSVSVAALREISVRKNREIIRPTTVSRVGLMSPSRY